MLGPSNINTSLGGSELTHTFAPAMGQTNQDSYNLMDTTGSTSQTNDSAPFSWEVIGLGLEEPLPASDIINEL